MIREQQNKSYRGVEALLRDSEHWCKQIGMRRVPDHNTLCRAFKMILGDLSISRLMDMLARWMGLAKAMGTVCAIDSTLYDTISIPGSLVEANASVAVVITRSPVRHYALILIVPPSDAANQTGITDRPWPS
jgi:hypothetical protein